MPENKNSVKLGDGLADGVVSQINQEALSICNLFLEKFFAYIKGKAQDIDFEKLFSKKDKDELVFLWSSSLAEKGLLPRGYDGLPDNLLIDNLHQDGYLSGLYAGYALALMSLADNNASKELILSVRDDVRPNLVGHHYNDRGSFFMRYQDEAYSWIEKDNIPIPIGKDREMP